MVKFRNETYRFHFPVIFDPENPGDLQEKKKKRNIKNDSSQKKKNNVSLSLNETYHFTFQNALEPTKQSKRNVRTFLNKKKKY
jgi:hypothetical protein